MRALHSMLVPLFLMLLPGGTVWGFELPVGNLEGPASLARDLESGSVWALVVCILYGAFGLYHLYLFQRNPQFRQYLWFGLLSCTIGAYTLLTSQWIFYFPLSTEWLQKVEYGLLYLTPALFMSMIWALLDIRPRAWVYWYQRTFYFAALAALLVPGFESLFHNLQLWQLWVVPLIAGMAGLVIYQAWRGNTEARTILPGVLLFSTAALGDMVVDLDYLYGPSLMSIGFAALLVSMAISMANHITRIFNNLEFEVEERTRELSQLNARLDEAASVDSLTRILNRRGFSQKAQQEIARVGRTQRGFALVMADIDYFKKFNDQYGHACGDYVLQRVADLLRRQLRDVDTIARWGGEEFILLLPETSLKGGEIVADKLRQSLEASSFQYGADSFSLTMTFGVALYRNGMTLDECLLRADRALYQGKKLGRNRVEGEAEDRQIDLLGTT